MVRMIGTPCTFVSIFDLSGRDGHAIVGLNYVTRTYKSKIGSLLRWQRGLKRAASLGGRKNEKSHSTQDLQLFSKKKTMASTITAPSTTAPHLLSNDYEAPISQTVLKGRETRDVVAEFNYYKDPGDGSPPAPTYVGKPETYERPSETRTTVVHDIRGEEDKYTLDTTGFQIYTHVSQETAFEDEAEIKRVYYPEVEDILKSA